jgi:hypothetical protein
MTQASCPPQYQGKSPATICSLAWLTKPVYSCPLRSSPGLGRQRSAGTLVLNPSNINIEVVLIDTQAHKAIDVFYITADGTKVQPEKRERLEEALRQACEAGA